MFVAAPGTAPFGSRDRARMPLHTAEALILRTYKLGEADRIVVFLTRDRGKRRGVARGARRPRSPFTGALEPLTRVGVAYFETERRELVSLNYAETERSPLTSPSPEAVLYAEYFAELLDESAPEGDPSETLFRLGASTLDALVAGVPTRALARYFEFWLLRLQGIYPAVHACGWCGQGLDEPAGGGAGLVLADGCFVCCRCLEAAARPPGIAGPLLSPEAVRFIRSAAAAGPGRAAQLGMGPRAARELELVHLALITAHFEREPRSVRVLRDVGQ